MMRRALAYILAFLVVLCVFQFIANTRFILALTKASPPTTVIRLDFARGSIVYTEFMLSGGIVKAHPWDASIHTPEAQYRAEFGPYHLLPSFGNSWVIMPLWLIALPAALLSLLLFMKRRPAPDLCPRCSYSLAGLASPICPECGTRC